MLLKNFKLLDIIIYQKNKTKKENENLIKEMTVIVPFQAALAWLHKKHL